MGGGRHGVARSGSAATVSMRGATLTDTGVVSQSLACSASCGQRQSKSLKMNSSELTSLSVRLRSSQAHERQSRSKPLQTTLLSCSIANLSTHTIGFKYGVKTAFTAGFKFLAEQKIEVSFDFNHEHQWTNAKSTATLNQINCPISVPPDTKVCAKVVYHEVKLNVPYVMKFKSGKIVDGIWSGVAYSTVEGVYSKL